MAQVTQRFACADDIQLGNRFVKKLTVVCSSPVPCVTFWWMDGWMVCVRGMYKQASGKE